MTRIAFIGDGAIARSVRQALTAQPDIEIVAILTQDAPVGHPYVETLDALLARQPALVAECAGHGALKAYGAEILNRGLALVVASIGALADQGIHEQLLSAQNTGGGSLILPAGAIVGIDGLSAARLDDLTSVTYTSRKPPHAWHGTIAEVDHDLDHLSQETVIFEGNAREAALLFPKNANVAATVALFGIGFERTRVRILADPAVSRNTHELTYDGAFGHCELCIANEPSPQNPKTSRLTAFSIASRIIDWAQTRGDTHSLEETHL